MRKLWVDSAAAKHGKISTRVAQRADRLAARHAEAYGARKQLKIQVIRGLSSEVRLASCYSSYALVLKIFKTKNQE